MYIEDYLDKRLYFQLRERDIKYRYIQQVQNDIKNRMYSLLSVWGNKKKREAIRFFDSINFEILEQELDTDFTDVYEEAIKKYPLAWKAIFELANMETQETVCDFRLPENEMDRETEIEVTSTQKKLFVMDTLWNLIII